MRHVILTSVPCLAVPYFSTLYPHLHYCREKKLLNIKCAFWFYTQLLSVTFFILRTIQRDIVHALRPSCRVRVILVIFYRNLNSLGGFSKNNQISNFMKVGGLEAELLASDGRMDRRTDAAKLTVVFRHFANASEHSLYAAVVLSSAEHFLCFGIYICLNMLLRNECFTENYCFSTNALSMYIIMCMQQPDTSWANYGNWFRFVGESERETSLKTWSR